MIPFTHATQRASGSGPETCLPFWCLMSCNKHLLCCKCPVSEFYFLYCRHMSPSTQLQKENKRGGGGLSFSKNTPVLLPGKSHGLRSLEGCSPWGCWGSDMTERLHFQFSLSCVGEGNGNPLQCSCLENPKGGGAWWAAVYGVAWSQTRLKWLSSRQSDPWFMHVIEFSQTSHEKVIFIFMLQLLSRNMDVSKQVRR